MQKIQIFQGKSHIQMSKSGFSLIVLLLLVLVNGCIPQKETVYLQNKADDDGYENPYSELTTITERYILQPNDELIIQVKTSNPELSEFFNSGQSGSSGMQRNQSLYTYPIDDDMNIDFPFVGNINLEGCNLKKAKEKIEVALKPFVNDAHIKVRMANNSFVILGEVGSPGRIEMGKDQVTVYEAIALAGDLATFGNRKEIKIVRPQEEGYKTFFIDLTDNSIVGSDEYYIYPNDLIYVKPMKAKSFGIGETFSFGVLSTVIAMYFTLQTIFN